MLFCSKVQTGKVSDGPAQADGRASDTGTIVMGGGFRLPVRTADNGTIRLGGGFRLPVRGA